MSYKKYYLYKKQVSNDNGITWQDVMPLETAISGESIGTYDTLAECEGTAPTHDYSQDYLTLVAMVDNTNFIFSPANGSNNVMTYSVNNGVWTEGNSVTVNSGDRVRLKMDSPTIINETGIGRISTELGKTFNVEGNIMSLEYGDNFVGQTAIYPSEFENLFSFAKVINTENLVLPATILANYCYSSMFKGCSSLQTAPELPATTLTGYCYSSMFQGCTSLTTTPALSATTLADYCYSSMFQGCTSLQTAPALPATTLASFCYQYMFSGCTSLTTAPALSATTLADYCYYNMFGGCTSLTTAPALPATTLANGCYNSMFEGCTSLRTAPVLPATTLVFWCYQEMFKNCSRLNYIKCLATDISANNCTYLWLSGVASTGTFVKNASMSEWSSGNSGIPNGWTVQDAT